MFKKLFKKESGMRKRKTLLLVIGFVLILATPAWAIFTNGGFESGDFTGWTTGFGLNPGLTGSPPFNETNIVINAGGTFDSLIIGPGTVQDPRTDNLLQLPREGTHTAKVNDENGGYHINYIMQSDVITEADRDPGDNLLHVRFRFAAVMEDPGHPPADQPFFHVYLKDLTAATTLFDSFAYSNQPGVTWNTSTMSPGWLWLDWQSIDITVPDASLGHTLSIRALAADCAQGAHGGYVYLDGFGSAPPPPPPPPQVITPVPTLTEWGMILFMVLAGAGSLYYLRRRKAEK